MNRIHFLFLLTCNSLFFPLSATTCINTEDFHPGITDIRSIVYPSTAVQPNIRALQREEKQLLRFEKRYVRFQKQLIHQQQQRIGGFNDSVDRWFWFWVIGWGLGLFLTIVSGGTLTTGALGIIWILSFAFGSVSLIIWLLKRFQ